MATQLNTATANGTQDQDNLEDTRRRRSKMSNVNMPSGTKTSIIIPSRSSCNCSSVGANLKLITLRQNGQMSGREYKIIHDEMTKTVNNPMNYTIRTTVLWSFMANLPGTTPTLVWRALFQIQKIQNCCLWSKFRAKEKQIAAQIGYVNERMLFHGSPTADHIVKTGFDLGRANGGLFGKGIYFAPNSSKSHSYTRSSSPKILLCRVALGRMHRLNTTQSMNQPPNNHHSVEGRLTVTEYVIYDADQAYPEYIIYYN